MSNHSRPSYLFTYGTLMRGLETSLTNFLEKNSTFHGEGKVIGRLFDLGSYPALVIDATEGIAITGHIFELQKVEATLLQLDRYEGIDPNIPSMGEYRREAVSVRKGDKYLSCWVYLYNLSTDQLSSIPFGNYLDFIRQNTDHQNFIKSV